MVFKPDNIDIRLFDKYSEWIRTISFGTMTYLASERHTAPRRDPRLLWPEVRSILSVAVPYDNPASLPKPADGLPRGRIAAYAWQQDYHQTLPILLDRQMQSFQEKLGKPFQWRCSTDSAPILERGLAAYAGLGWIGRNGSLIQPGVGSYLLLAEVFTDLEPEVLEELTGGQGIPVTDHCGTCRRCIEACPTGCIRDDRTLDAGRCISYLTIEHKGQIPRDLRPLLGDWVFGCDICQMVCPWNDKHASREAPESLAIPTPFPELITELALSETEFKQKYARTPILRTKRKGYLRNICMALGNLADPASVEALADLLAHDAEPLVRASAAWALGRIGGITALTSLESAASSESDENVIDEIQHALNTI